MMMDTYVGLTAGYGGPLGTAPALSCLRQPVNLMVNQKGLRFMREDLCENPGYTGNAVHRQYKGCAVSILDETMYQEFLEASKKTPMGPTPGDLIDPDSTKYYGARIFCDTYGGLGGVKINHKAQVLDEAEDPVPGLYAAGNDTNTIYGGAYPFYLCGNTSSFAINTGRFAGKDVAKKLRGQFRYKGSIA